MRLEAKSWHESKAKQTHLIEPKRKLKSEEQRQQEENRESF
jgi:hypothetical protein